MKTFKEIREEQLKVQENWFEEWHVTGSKPNWDFEEVAKAIEIEWLQSLQVGDKAHICMYTDIEPCTVIKRTATTLTVRRDKAEMNGTWKPEVVLGGFVGHCINQHEQADGWDITEDENGATETFRWSKKYNQWMNTCGEKCRPEWMKFYDYNF